LGGAPVPVRIADVVNVDLFGEGDRRAVDAGHARLLDLAARTGAEAVNAIAYQPALPPPAQAGGNLGRLCDLAADRGLRISFEFLPFTGVAGIRSVAQLLEATDRENLGIVLDLWHWARSPEGQDIEALKTIPGDRIHVLQLGDAPAEVPADIVTETVTARLLPGEGACDIPAVLEALEAIGAAPVIASEVFSDDLVAQGPGENARRQYEAGRDLFAQYVQRRRRSE
jgi:sugar phosphate isomerase/epimerase